MSVLVENWKENKTVHVKFNDLFMSWIQYETFTPETVPCSFTAKMRFYTGLLLYADYSAMQLSRYTLALEDCTFDSV